MSGAKHAFAIRVLEDLRRGYLAIAQALAYGPSTRSRYRDNAAALALSITALKGDQRPTDYDLMLQAARTARAWEKVTGQPWHDDPAPFVVCSTESCGLHAPTDSQGLRAAVEYLVEHRRVRHADEDPLAISPAES